MGWNPLKDIENAVSDLGDSINKNVFDDMLGIESVTDFVKNPMTAFSVDASTLQANKQRIGAKVERAKVAGADALRRAQEARDLPYILANQELAARRRKMRDQSLLASGATGSAQTAPLSSVMAQGKQTLGA